MSLTDIARGRRSVRDRKTTRATNGTGSKGLTARTPIHSSYAAAMRIAGWPAERRRVADRGDRIRSESLDGARWRSTRNDRGIGRTAPWEKALRAIGSRCSPLKCTGIRVTSRRTYPHRRPPVGRFAARTHLCNSQRSESLYGGHVHIEKRASSKGRIKAVLPSSISIGNPESAMALRFACALAPTLPPPAPPTRSPQMLAPKPGLPPGPAVAPTRKPPSTECLAVATQVPQHTGT